MKDLERQAKGNGEAAYWVFQQAKKLAAAVGKAHDVPTVVRYRNAIGAMKAGRPGIWASWSRCYRPFPPEVEKLRGTGPRFYSEE